VIRFYEVYCGKKSLELNPQNTNAIGKLKKLER